MTIAATRFEEFEVEARAQGFDEVVERRWAPGTIIDVHAHPFALRAVVVEGEMWLTSGGESRHLKQGDELALEQGVSHAERYGPEGAAYWVARRTAKL
jgi:quercetin dioxygenase-like cupin family protein